jgi:DNA-binding transcriptional MocR family regulator
MTCRRVRRCPRRCAAARALCGPDQRQSDRPRRLRLKERRDIAAWALGAGVQIIEDDAYGLLPDAPIPAIASFAPGISWYIASMAKIISPALRVGFVRAPGVAEAMQLASCQHESAVMAPPLNVAMVSLWLADGTFDRLVDAVRKEAMWRQKLARTVLGEARDAAHPARLSSVVAAPRRQQRRHAGRRAGARRAVGGDVGPLRGSTARTPKAMRVSLGGTIDRRGLVARAPPARRAAVGARRRTVSQYRG